MNMYKLNAGGYYTSGMALVAANSVEHALELANEASDPQWKLTYFGFGGAPKVGDQVEVNPHVIAIHEYGLPDMPSKGSGIKVTF